MPKYMAYDFDANSFSQQYSLYSKRNTIFFLNFSFIISSTALAPFFADFFRVYGGIKFDYYG